MRKYIYGYYNRKTNSYEHFAIFDDVKQLIDYEGALYRCSRNSECKDFEFQGYTLYPNDYSVFCLGTIDYAPSNHLDWLKIAFENLGDFDVLLGVHEDFKGDVEDVEDSDCYDSEPIYSGRR